MAPTISAPKSKPVGDSDLPILSQEWLLHLEDVKLNLALADQKMSPPVSPTLPPPVPPRRLRHDRSSSLPVKTTIPVLQPSEKERTTPAQSPSPRPSNPPSSFHSGLLTPPDTPGRKRPSPPLLSSTLIPVPEDSPLPSPTIFASRSYGPDPILDHIPPRPGSSMSVREFVPVSTHDYPYTYLLGVWDPSYPLGRAEERSEGEEEREWAEVDEQKWEEERSKAFEWIRLKKVVRRMEAAKLVRATRRTSTPSLSETSEGPAES